MTTPAAAHTGAMAPAAGAPSRSGALPRAEYAAIVSTLDTVPSLACPNFRLLAAQHPG